MRNKLCGLTAIVLLNLAPRVNVLCAPTHRPMAEIESFNDGLRLATASMSPEALLGLWEEEGITLLPDAAPIMGKPAIARYLREVMTQLGLARMREFDFNCFDIIVSGVWASEWCAEHQIVDLGKDKPPFDGRGNMLLVLHRGADRKWRLVREMWNQAAR